MVRALLHDLKATAWCRCRGTCHTGARRPDGFAAMQPADFAPPCGNGIDMAKIYRRALRAMPETIDDQLLLPVPESCPVTLDELLAEGLIARPPRARHCGAIASPRNALREETLIWQHASTGQRSAWLRDADEVAIRTSANPDRLASSGSPWPATRSSPARFGERARNGYIASTGDGRGNLGCSMIGGAGRSASRR